MKDRAPLPKPQKHLTLYLLLDSRSEIFKGQELLGWEILELESCLYSITDVTIESITVLTSLYMKIIEKLNALQDPREQYFTLKMQKLMAEPYVIRCFNATSDDNKKNSLEARRKELEQRLEKEVERQNHRKVLQQAISAQEQKEEKMMNKVKEIVELSNRKLEDRIRRRAEASEMRNSILNSSQFIASEGSFYSQSPPRSSANFLRHDRFHSPLNSNGSTFELHMSEDYFNSLKRQLAEEEQEQRAQARLQRERQLNAIPQ